MTANIAQHVVPRKRLEHNFSYSVTQQGTWQTRALRRPTMWRLVNTYTQQGSVTQSTVTVGFAVMALVLVAMLGFFYLQQVFGTATQGTEIQTLQSDIAKLRETQRSLELEGARLRSIQAVEQRVNALNMVSVDAVAYLAQQPGKVAVATQ